jgi:hypothetical protein
LVDLGRAEVGMALAERDIRRAWFVLMRVQMLLCFSRKQLGGLPDAPALDHYLAVALPMTRPSAYREHIRPSVMAYSGPRPADWVSSALFESCK